MLDVTRRIEREAGSAYRINGKEVRARDVRILFEDAATGARSPALVRQGQIGEIVNAKPEQRRRILEDAAGIAGPAQPPPRGRAAPARGRRQSRPPQRHPGPAQLADRKPEAAGAAGAALQGIVDRDPQARRHRRCICAGWRRRARSTSEEAGLVDRAGEGRPRHRGRSQGACAPKPKRPSSFSRCASRRPPRAPSCIASRSSRRTSSARPQRNAERRRDLEARVEQLTRDRAREEALIAEAKETLARLEARDWSRSPTPTSWPPNSSRRRSAAYDEADDRPQGRRDAAQRAHHGRGRSAGAPPEHRGPAARAQGARAEARAPADGARSADARDRRPRAGCLQAQGDGRGRPAADGRDRRDRAADRSPPRTRSRPQPPTPRPRASWQPRSGWPPASSGPRSRRSPSC